MLKFSQFESISRQNKFVLVYAQSLIFFTFLFQDHIKEVLAKWDNIDDEIWAKIIVLERNRRVAKAYARAPVLTINGSDDGFDGFRIGVAGFDNPMRDAATDDTIRRIGQGFKLKMDDLGNILVRSLNILVETFQNNIALFQLGRGLF